MTQERGASRVAHWYLGQTSERFETSGSGVDAISTGSNDRGGASYGAYQLSSKAGTLQEYLAQSRYGAKFEGLVPATPEFNRRWHEIATADPAFGQDQHDFIGSTHYKKQLQRLDGLGLSLGGRGRAVQDALWSTSVQFRDLTTGIVVGGLEESFPNSKPSDLTDRQIIAAIQDYKYKHNESLFKSSPGLWLGLRNRARSEETVLLDLADAEMLVKAEPPDKIPDHDRAGLAAAKTQKQTLIERQQALLQRLGYCDAIGKSLVVDGDIGPNTRHAVKSFQRAHGLRVDGVVGRHTLAALENAQRWPLLSEATHPHHTLYDQVAQGIHRVPQLHGKKDLDNAAVALTVAADAAGMRRIDHVVLGSDGVNLFAVQGRLDDPAHRRVHVELAHAMTHPAEHHSMSTAPGHVQAIAAQQQAVQQRGPVMMGP